MSSMGNVNVIQIQSVEKTTLIPGYSENSAQLQAYF